MAGKRYSRQRELIYEAVKGSKEHPTAEMVFQWLKPENPGLSLGTVYRNLAFFQERGLVQSVGVVQGQERFDAIVAPHSHFVCECCGTVLDLPGICPEGELEQAVSRQYGVVVERRELTFFGRCPECVNQQNLKEEPLS